MTLQKTIEHAIDDYLLTLDEETPTDMHALFMAQMERPLLIALLRHTRGNQSKTAKMLGLNRGTLRAKMKAHGLL